MPRARPHTQMQTFARNLWLSAISRVACMAAIPWLDVWLLNHVHRREVALDSCCPDKRCLPSQPGLDGLPVEKRDSS
jgi:hypothetical protein